jgi:hypothetical protein
MLLGAILPISKIELVKFLVRIHNIQAVIFVYFYDA